MKKSLIVLSFLLLCAGAFAQQYARITSVTRPIAAGAVREEKSWST